jgi:hypothetical protein
MRLRVLTAVLAARIYELRPIALYSCITAVIVGSLGPQATAAPVFFCSLVGIVMALAQSPGRYPHLDRCEQSAPLFGRELARAKALVPCVAATFAVIAYILAAMATGSPNVSLTLAISLPAVIATTLIALSATIRRGAPQALYLLLACTASVTAYALAVVARSLLAELAFCAIVAFMGLRQYGEALARYDPV